MRQRAVILKKRTHWNIAQCNTFIREIGDFSRALATMFNQSLSRMDYKLAQAVILAEKQNQLEENLVTNICPAREITGEELDKIFSCYDPKANPKKYLARPTKS